jgi:hypothetical protein
MEYATPRKAINGSTAVNGVFYAVCADGDVTQQQKNSWKRSGTVLRDIFKT